MGREQAEAGILGELSAWSDGQSVGGETNKKQNIPPMGTSHEQ